MALIPFTGAYSGPEYDPGSGSVGFVNYGTDVSESKTASNFPPVIAFGFSGILKFGTMSRDFVTDRNSFHFNNLTAGTSSTDLIVEVGSRIAEVTYLDSSLSSSFEFTSSDRLQMVCTQASANEASINVNIGTWIERVGDDEDYFIVTTSVKDGPSFTTFNNPFSYGAGASEGVAATSTTGITVPLNCELTFAAVCVSDIGRDAPLPQDLDITIKHNGLPVGTLTVVAGQLVGIYTGVALAYSAGSLLSLEPASANPSLISLVGTFTFRIT